MLKKYFQVKPSQEKRKFSKQEMGKGIALPMDMETTKGHTPSYSPLDLLSALDPIDAALIMDKLYDDFQFDWESALSAIQSMEASSTVDGTCEFGKIMHKDCPSQMQELKCREVYLLTKQPEFPNEPLVTHRSIDIQNHSQSDISSNSSSDHGLSEQRVEPINADIHSAEGEISHSQYSSLRDGTSSHKL